MLCSSAPFAVCQSPSLCLCCLPPGLPPVLLRQRVSNVLPAGKIQIRLVGKRPVCLFVRSFRGAIRKFLHCQDIRQYKLQKAKTKQIHIRTAALKTQENSMEQDEKWAQSLFVLVTPSSPLPPSGGGKKRLRIAASNFPQDAASGDARLSAGLPPQPWTTARGACRRPAGPWEPSPPSFTALRPT